MKPLEVKSITLKEFDLMFRGYNKRQEKEWDRARHLMAYILNFAGMGSKQVYQPKEIFPLEMDKEHQKKMITTLQQAMDLLKEFKKWQG